MTYSEKLRDPRWQKKRLEVLSRNGFKCEACDSTENTLHVHHCYYMKADPWDYPDSAYKCLCEECHKNRQELELRINQQLATLSFHHLDLAQCDVFYAVAMHGMDEVSKKCKELRS
jgi:hypothetical protein